MKLYDMRDLPDVDGIREPIAWSRAFTPRRLWLIAGIVMLVIVVSGSGPDAAARRAATSVAHTVADQAARITRDPALRSP